MWYIILVVLLVLLLGVASKKNSGTLELSQSIQVTDTISATKALGMAMQELNAREGCCATIVKVLKIDKTVQSDMIIYTAYVMMYYNTESKNEQKLQKLKIKYDSTSVRLIDVEDVSVLPATGNSVQKNILKRWRLSRDDTYGLLYIDRGDPLYMDKDTIYVPITGNSNMFKNMTAGHPQYGKISSISYDPAELYESTSVISTLDFDTRVNQDQGFASSGIFPYASEQPVDNLYLEAAPGKIDPENMNVDILNQMITPPLSNLQHDTSYNKSILQMQYG